MAERHEERQAFTGFGFGLVPETQDSGGVFILAVYRDGGVTAAAHATERGAMEAAVEVLADALDDDEERGTLEDLFVRAQAVVADEGGVMEIIHSPIHGG